ncbi:hypothetical protein [Qipengyuania sp. 902]|uniref:hypothetical protein n=1 Tax=Qipengyuania sp. 902 TaxID=3417565 RepID=UPI003EBB662E
MSVPAYSEYKDSGVPWLGQVPARWPIVQSRRYFSLRRERASEGDRQLTASQKWGVIYQDDYTRLEGQQVVQVILNAEILKKVEPNDFVISMRSFQGGIEWCGLCGSISSAYVMLIPSDDVVPAYFRYLFKSKGYIQALQSTSNLVRDGQAMRYDNFVQVPLPMPSQEEQKGIAAFLDRETAKIDALVAEQEQLIALLKEKRQAVISHAVTKGLDPDAPMKDSGIEWLGEIPATWECLPFKRYIASSNAGEVIDKSYWGDGQELLYTCAIEPIRSDFSAFPDWKRTADRDLLLTRNGTPYVHEPEPSSIYSNVVQRVTLEDGLYRRYMARAVQSAAFNLKGYGVSIESLNYEMWRGLVVPVPSPPEQEAIVTFIDQETAKIDDLAVEAQLARDLLKERRAVLVFAAVTGKIDVRGLVEQQEMEAA